VQPFGNSLVTLTLTGQQLLAVLDRQFAFGGFSVLQPSTTLRYKIATVGDGIEVLHSSVSVQSVPLDPSANYRVTVNNFLAENDPAFAAGTDRVTGGNDATAFVDYLAAKPSPYIVPVLDQVQFQ
jgi:5'-nucleotidase